GRGRMPPCGVRKDERAAALGHGGADPLGQLAAEALVLALSLEEEGRHYQARASHHEDRDRGLVLDFTTVRQNAGAAAAEDGARAGDATDRVEELVGTLVGIPGDEDKGEIGVVRPAPPRGLAGGS